MKNTAIPEFGMQSLVEESIDFHCHGVGRFDFTEINELDLEEIETILAQRKQSAILTLYLPKSNFEYFLDLMESFDKGRQANKFKHILGVSIEGPLLASHGGTPEKGVWLPTKGQWQELAKCGQKGLVYVIFSPDAQLNKTFHSNVPSVTWLAETLLEGGVLPTPGHFTKYDPVASANALQSVFDVVAAWGHGPTITDHLFNDMPRNFKHAWRTPAERARRDQEIHSLKLDTWSLDSLESDLGLVPATMIRNARKGLVKLCLNFDGEHVDLAVVKRMVELIGASNFIMMTDSIESKRLGGQQLHMRQDSTLLYQEKGIVAAGTQTIAQQIKNMLSIGLTPMDIKTITHWIPANVLMQRNHYIDKYLYEKSETACN